MKNLFSHKDGRLKTGRLAILVFIGLLICSGLLFKAKKPVDQVLVKVSHVFDAEQQIEEPAKEPEKNIKPDEVKPEPQDTIKASLPKPEKKKKLNKVKKASSLADNKKDNSQEESTVISKNPISGKSLAGLKKETEASSAAADNKERVEFPKIPLAAAPKQEKKEPVRLDVSKKLAAYSKIDPSKTKQKKPIQIHSGFADKLASQKNSKPNTNEIELEHAEYMDLMHSWNTSGKTPDETTNTIPLRVENLKSTYDLLQMKPVAVVNGSKYIDLTDGSRLSPEGLKNYCSTAFQVNDPWGKWGTELTRSGINKRERLEVRYYMYGFIRNAIYNRVQQAFNWSKQNGLIDPSTSESDVDVLGRTFIINRQGGGRFGVFVPLEINTATGQRVAVDPTSFNDQPDVQALMVAGVL